MIASFSVSVSVIAEDAMYVTLAEALDAPVVMCDESPGCCLIVTT
jgi:hypothetical protein